MRGVFSERRRLEERGVKEATAMRLRPGKASTAQLDDRLRGRLATQDALQVRALVLGLSVMGYVSGL